MSILEIARKQAENAKAKAKFTDDQLKVLEQGASGAFYQYRHVWTINGRPVGRAVNALKKRGLVSVTEYRERPGLSFTDEGRAVRKELGFA